jgi:DNA mismatch repair ATPase MutL
MSVTPVVVNFRRLIVDEDLDGTAVDGVRNRDLLHAVVALYDQSLPDVTTEIIYSHVCRAASKTLLFIRDKEGALQEIIEKDKLKNTMKEESSNDESCTDNTTSNVADSEINEGEDDEKEKENEEEKDENEDNEDEDESSAEETGLFDDVYSDTESSEESEESSDSEEEDLSAGSKEFVEAVKHRRELRSAGKFTDECIGIESQLAGAASFERLVGKDEVGVVQLSLIAVRRRYRKRGLGRRLINVNLSSAPLYMDVSDYWLIDRLVLCL